MAVTTWTPMQLQGSQSADGSSGTQHHRRSTVDKTQSRLSTPNRIRTESLPKIGSVIDQR